MPTRQNPTNLIQLSKSPRTPRARFAPEKNFFEIFSLGFLRLSAPRRAKVAPVRNARLLRPPTRQNRENAQNLQPKSANKKAARKKRSPSNKRGAENEKSVNEKSFSRTTKIARRKRRRKTAIPEKIASRKNAESQSANKKNRAERKRSPSNKSDAKSESDRARFPH